jgi:trk system potassium uptake protein TrkA
LKIFIAGAGEVGFELSKVLSQENHDIIVIDKSPESLKKCRDNLDILVYEGSATSVIDLMNAGISESDVMIAVTSVDEVNMVASMIARKLGVKKVIARVRNDELSRPDSPLLPTELGIDVLIHPELSAASEITQLIRRAAASDIVSLANGNMQLIGIRIEKNSMLIDKTLADAAIEISNIPFRITAISRRGRTIIPKGDNRLMALDHIYLICRTKDLATMITAAGHSNVPFRNIMIAGGTEVGDIIARQLTSDSHKWNIKLIEPDADRATRLANELRDVLVLHGNPTDPNLLVTEGIKEMDAFISVTEDEESNIIACLMAKHVEVRKTVALVSKPQYIPLSQTIGLDAAVNVKSSASDEIHKIIRQGELVNVRALKGIQAEVFEVVASNKCKVIDKKIEDIKFPDGCVIGGILKNGNSEIATGQTIIRQGDTVIIFALPTAINDVIALFK